MAFDKTTIKADFSVVVGGRRRLVTIERIEHPSPEYGDGSMHVLSEGGKQLGLIDTRYDMIPSSAEEWSDFWVYWLKSTEFGASEVTRIGFLMVVGKGDSK